LLALNVERFGSCSLRKESAMALGRRTSLDCRSAFTLVELLVVIAIIGILVMMLLPGVQAAREAARRVACQNNIRQVALAVGNYYSAKRAYPRSGEIGPPVPIPFSALSVDELDPRTGNMHSWMTTILPYLEEGAIYDRFNLSRSVLDQAENPQAVVLAPLICPSDDSGGSRIFRHPTLTRGKAFGKGNYAAYVSPTHVDLQHVHPGALVAHRHNTIRHIRDGLSKTLLLAEIRTRNDELDQRGAWALPWVAASVLSFDFHSVHHREDAFKVYVPDYSSLGVNQPPNNQGPNFDMLYHCDEQASQLEGMPCATYENAVFGNHWLSAAPRSRHPGGVYVAFLEGRVNFLLDEVDQVVMAYLVAINDFQTINYDEFVR
jgi:prepilin-type N-terminal cleavage/methylation domain-containing protein